MRVYTFKHSPNPLKVRIALAELGVEYDPVEIDLFAGEHRTPGFLAVNPLGKVPVLEDGDLVVPEVGAILSYLGQTRGGALWPPSPRGRAPALSWLFFDAFSLGNQCGAIWWTDVTSKAAGRPGAADAIVEDALQDLERALGVLEARVAERQYLMGDFCLSDCAVGVSVAMLRDTRLGERIATAYPNVAAYTDRVLARPSWVEAGGDGIFEFA